MNADLDRLQGGFKMNRFSIEPMIFNLEHIFQHKFGKLWWIEENFR